MQLASPPVRLKPDLTAAVVICTRNRPALLRNCLEAVAHSARIPDELIVVDNTSGDKITESVALEFSARYILEPVQGLSRARNRALTEGKSEIVAYLDDDAVPDEHWLEFLLEPFADPCVAAATGGTILPGSYAIGSNQVPTWLLCNKDRQWFEIAAFGGLGIGTNMALRRAACMGWNVFDERLGRGALFEGMEEHHAFVRILSLGYSAAHVPAAIVFHRSQKRGDIKQEARNQIGYSMLLFAEYPVHRLELLRFLFRRLRRRPLTWLRDSPDPGEIITSGWRVLLPASFGAALLFFRTNKLRSK
jgi:glycosyltransferase involved in cell wall biosynthesis